MLSQGTNQAKARSVICAAGRLIHCFDRISANGLDRLVTVRAEVSPGLRFVEGLCLLKAIPFRDSHALGWGWPLQANNLSAARAEVDLLRSLVQPRCALQHQQRLEHQAL